MSDEQQSRLKLGPRIWNESLLSTGDYTIQSRVYNNSYISSKPPEFFKSDYEWRWRMGGRLTTDEIKLISKRMDDFKNRIL